MANGTKLLGKKQQGQTDPDEGSDKENFSARVNQLERLERMARTEGDCPKMGVLSERPGIVVQDMELAREGNCREEKSRRPRWEENVLRDVEVPMDG